MQHLRMTIRSQTPGGFRPTSFDHLLQEHVQAAGLDPRHHHRLIGVQVADDGNSAELLLHSEPPDPAIQMVPAFRFVNGTPTAKVRVVLAEDRDRVLCEVQLNAPLMPGQRIALGEQEYLVLQEDWPGRDPVTGVCAGELDWQHAYVTAVEPISALPQLAGMAVPIPAPPPVITNGR